MRRVLTCFWKRNEVAEGPEGPEGTGDPAKKMTTAIEALIQCSDQCDAVIRKNDRLSIALGKDIKELMKAHIPPKSRIRLLLVRRSLIKDSSQRIYVHTVQLFKHKLILEEALLNSTIGDALSDVTSTLRQVSNINEVGRVETMMSALEEMTDTVSDISSALSTAHLHSDFDVDSDELDDELDLLMQSATARTALSSSISVTGSRNDIVAPLAPNSELTRRDGGDFAPG